MPADKLDIAAALACIDKMQRLGTQTHVWALGQILQNDLRELSAKYPHLKITIGGQPAAPSLAFDLGADSAAAKMLYIRYMVTRGFLVSGQYYVMGTHDDLQVQSLLAALDEVFAALDSLKASGQLQATAGNVRCSQGFGRLA